MPVDLASFVPLNAINMATEFKTCNALAPRAYSATLGYNPRHILRSIFRHFFWGGVLLSVHVPVENVTDRCL